MIKAILVLLMLGTAGFLNAGDDISLGQDQSQTQMQGEPEPELYKEDTPRQQITSTLDSANTSLVVELENGPLADLKKVFIKVEIDAGSKKAGLTLDLLKADIKSRLVLLKIPVTFVDKAPNLDPRAYPLLTLVVDMGVDKKWYRPDTFLVSANLKDMVRLERDLNIRSSAALWSVAEHGYDNRIVQAVRLSIMRLTDAFVLSYAQANRQLLDPKIVQEQEAPKAAEPDPLAP